MFPTATSSVEVLADAMTVPFDPTVWNSAGQTCGISGATKTVGVYSFSSDWSTTTKHFGEYQPSNKVIKFDHEYTGADLYSKELPFATLKMSYYIK